MASISKPEITVPSGNPPTELLIEDLVVGDGHEATAGKNAEVHYVGVSWSTGKEFDASWNSGNTFSFGLGQSQVIAGWDQGVQGMKIGGRRRLTIPPHLGYGTRGAGNVIKPNETLIFVVDLLDAQ
jgi:peptidylprolyl isomerase